MVIIADDLTLELERKALNSGAGDSIVYRGSQIPDREMVCRIIGHRTAFLCLAGGVSFETCMHYGLLAAGKVQYAPPPEKTVCSYPYVYEREIRI